MGRTVSAWVTYGDEVLGVSGPFAVDVPWWSEVEPVVAHLRQALRVPVVVLRLLRVEGGDGARDGHVTYHVEALARPDAPLPGGPAEPGLSDEPHPLRSPWARREGLMEALTWASEALAAAGRRVVGPVEQRKTWNLAGLFRLPTADGPVWLKTTPAFGADEAAVIGAFARVDPGLVPVVLAAAEGRMLMEHLPGVDCWQAGADVVTAAVTRFVAAQAALSVAPASGTASPAAQAVNTAASTAVAASGGGASVAATLEDRVPGLADRRTEGMGQRVRTLLAGEGGRELTAREVDEAHGLLERLPQLEACGLPDTLVHGDFHPGNWRSDGGPPVVVDFADAHLGNPVLDGLRAWDFLPEDRRSAAAAVWIDAWKAAVPGSDPARALAVGEPLAHLAYAVRYQEFLDGIEPSERVYHQGDPAASVRAALRAANEPGFAPAW
ncbi:aminoglycoside phosphotransferase family protein [Microbispora sp. ATCC PTA-5024]|uniref:aminoglycoside phosphotransferase family protein n=1 Tax=Microbispora sp. ATCC PTA-5024 TaxID=316330 RepID=UPI00040102F3|nr:aminoglycoside phosphotransferase family protein [Microbispora sp. ATCC PTA-5024]